MFLHDVIRRRLSSLLQPWLQEESSLELKLGFTNSRVIAENLLFDTSVLNQLFDEFNGFCFKEVVIEHLSVRFATWSAPAFSIQIRGLHITLSTREEEGRGSRRKRNSRDGALEKIKNAISAIDPQGCALHDALERILSTRSSRNSFKTSFLKLILKQCHLQILSSNLQFQFPIFKDSISYLLEIKVLTVKSRDSGHGCLLQGLVGALFLPVHKNSLFISGSGLEFVYKRNDQLNHVCFSDDIFTCIILNDLQLVDFNVQIPELSFLFSPSDLPVFLALGKLTSKEYKYGRNGRELWRIAARRIRHLISPPRLSMQKLVDVVIIWLHYVNAYENMLSLVGYSSEEFFKRSAVKMSQDKSFLTSVRQNWEVISNIEKQLPAEAISLARRTARYRAAFDAPHAENSYRNPLISIFFQKSYKILSLLANVWRAMRRIFLSFTYFSFSRKILSQEPEVDKNMFEFSCMQCQFILSIGKILITVYTDNRIQPVKNSETPVKTLSLDFLSFCFSVEDLLLMHKADVIEQSSFISCGQLKIKSSNLSESPYTKRSSKDVFSSMIECKSGTESDFKTILWGEPAQMFLNSEMDQKNSAGCVIGHLENSMTEMWLRWKRTCMKFEENEIGYPENPFFLCEIKNFLMCQDLKIPDSGLWKCNLTAGKLNLMLGLSSMLSMFVFLRQLQYTQSWVGENRKGSVLSHFPHRIEYQKGISWNDKYEFCASRTKMAFLRVLPEKHIQLGIFITGPCIQITLGKNELDIDMNGTVRHDDFHIGFDVHNIEAVVWPTSKSELARPKVGPMFDEMDVECLGFQELRIIEVPSLDNQKYASQGWVSLCLYLRVNGLSAFVGNAVENHQGQIFILKPIILQLSFFREYVYSLSMAVTAFSTALNGLAMGFSVVSLVDELCTFFQVVLGSSSALSHALNNIPSVGYVPRQEFVRSKMLLVAKENEETSAGGTSLICSRTFLLINVNFKLKSVDIVLHSLSVNSQVERFMKSFDYATSKQLGGFILPDCGIWSSVLQTCLDITYEEKLKIIINLHEIQSVIFRYKDRIPKFSDLSTLKNLLLEPHNCLYEATVSNCVFTLCLSPMDASTSSRSVNDTHGVSTSVGKTSDILENSQMINEHGMPRVQSYVSVQNPASDSNFTELVSSHWLLINVALSEVFFGRCLVKRALVGIHQFKKLQSWLSVGEKFQTISCGIQGGLLFLEPIAFVMFIQYFSLYFRCITSLLSTLQSSLCRNETPKVDLEMTGLNDSFAIKYDREIIIQSQEIQWEIPEIFSIDMSQCTLIFVVEDGSGRIWELVLENNIHSELKLGNMQKKFIFEIPRILVLSQVLQEKLENGNGTPHFSSLNSKEVSSYFASNNSTDGCPQGAGFDDASCSKDPISQKGSALYECVLQLEVFSICHQNHILKHLGAFVSVMKSENNPPEVKQAWVGNGYISGCDVTISLYELQMVMSIVSYFAGLSSLEMNGQSVQHRQSYNQETDTNFEPMVPDGTIVAVQDVQQHLYFAVEGGGDMYTLVGALHYSIVGERALFRVKYHHQRRWRSSVLWFSLISLYAKNNMGEPLRLNYCSGSGFVHISCTLDGSCALWRMLSRAPESYKGNIEWEPYNLLVKDTFYLVNRKSDCAVAFINGLPEFVRKPGNPFKLKVFNDHEIATFSRYSLVSSAIPLHPDAEVYQDGRKMSVQMLGLSSISISVDEVAFTIVDELLETRDRFPLLRGSISNTQLTLQVLPTKFRVISTSKASISYFDAQRNLWREFVHPVEVCTFYCSNFQNQDSESVLHKLPINIYCRTGKIEISLTKISLDILIFVIGKLNLAGPFSVRSSAIMAYCCKVENHSGLNLLCDFKNNQHVTIGRKQSASVFLRNFLLANQPSNTAPVVSIQLSASGSIVTSSINFSLSKTQVLSWRTRIVCQQDSKTFPGPFIVIDISRKSEDGLSIVVSPLLRIHNETEFFMELLFQRPWQKQEEFASVMLKPGDTVDDSMAAFDAVSFSGGLKKALASLSVGNFLFSFRPSIPEEWINSESPLSVEWSDELQGGQAVRLSGIFDKLSYGVRKVLSTESIKYSFSTAFCALKSEDACVGNMHFLIQTIRRDVPIIQPDKCDIGYDNQNSPIALQEQKEIFLLPTVRVSNFLHLEIHVLLTETDQFTSMRHENIGKQATIPCGSTRDFYVNPAMIYFTVTLSIYSSSCKPVNSVQWIKKIFKQKSNVKCLDVDLDFGDGKYHASLRLSRGHKGTLEAAVFTSYSLKNDSDFPLFFFARNARPLSSDEIRKFGPSIPPDLGLVLPPKSTKSWLLRSHKVWVKLLEDFAYEAPLDLDALSGLTEISLEMEKESGVKFITKFGLSVGPSLSLVAVPSQTITMVPRYIVLNEAEETIVVRQCFLEDESAGVISINSREGAVLQLLNGLGKRRELSLFENFIKKHGNDSENSLVFIQFLLNDPKLTWSGPLCITSLGCFFLKFRKQSNELMANNKTEFASVIVAEEDSTLVVHFQKPPSMNLPYRIENYLHGASLTFYQKDSLEPEVLGPECSVAYAWDDLTLPHKLLVLINDMHPLREIRLDKVRPWKPFFKVAQHRGLPTHFLLGKNSREQKANSEDFKNMEMVKIGFEVYAEGPTRVLRICEFSYSHKEDIVLHSCTKIQLRISQVAIHLLERGKLDFDDDAIPFYVPIIIARFGNIDLDSVFTDRKKYNQIGIHSLNVDEKWAGAPFAAMFRRHQSDSSDRNDYVFNFVFVLLSTSSNVKQVKYCSMVLQPIDLNLDEETLMRIVSFWRTSLSDSNSQSQQFYFDHFEIHPMKIITNFLPGDSYSSYNSAQETLRSLLHGVVKVPPIKNMVVELNGVLITHALITMRELFIRCAQHYSWYTMRAIYIAKGSPLLPPAFASIFDDLASSSLDAFFDPSQGLTILPGFTIGTFKFISKCINGKGFSGTKRYFGDIGKTLRTAGSNVLFATVTEISDSVLRGAETNGFDGMVSGFHQGILKLAMEPTLLGTALMGGGPDRKIKLDRSPGVDELYIEGYLQAMLDSMYRQEYLRVRVIDDQVFLKNLPPNSSLINEIMDSVKGFLVSKALLKGDPSTMSHPLHHLRRENEWKLGPTLQTLCEHLFVSYAIRMLRKRTNQLISGINKKKILVSDDVKAIVPVNQPEEKQDVKLMWKWSIGKFLLSGILAYIDGRLCRCIPNPLARRIVSGFLLSFLDKNDDK